MINPKTAPQSHPHRVLDPPSFTGTPGSKPARVLPQDKIPERAYKLYEDRAVNMATPNRTGFAPNRNSVVALD